MCNRHLGKIENSQISGRSSPARGQQPTLVDIRFSLPETWCDDPMRCDQAG